MAIDLDAIRKKLSASQNPGKTPSKTKELIWKPNPGKQVIRIVDYQHQPGNPLVELKFHYGLHGPQGRSYLSPSTFNNPDPLVKLEERLKKAGGDDWKRARKLERTIGPKTRTYVPVIVRGEEDKGVRFWGFGKLVADQLMELMLMDDYNGFTDLNSGYDIQIDFKKAEKEGEWPKTTLFVKPKPRPVIDPSLPNAKELIEKITTKQPHLVPDVYQEASYEELSAALEEYLKKSEEPEDEDDENVKLPSDEQMESAAAASKEKKVEVITSPVEKVVEKVVENVVEKTAEVVSPSAEKAAENATKPAKSLADAFANVFDTD